MRLRSLLQSSLVLVQVSAASPVGRPFGEFHGPRLKASQQKHDAEVQHARAAVRAECGDLSSPQSPCRRESEDALRLMGMDSVLTDRLPLDRFIPDPRYAACHRDEGSYKSAGTVSVILVFYNEATSTLLRTAQSVLDRTKEASLLEVLLVSDGASPAPWAKKQKNTIKAFCKKHPKVRHVKLKVHAGLAPAKAKGAKLAKGDLLVFLDSHCEVNDGWLEPLADRVARNRRAVAIPVIDGIDASTFRYTPGADPTRGVFTWGMYYAGEPYGAGDRALLADGQAVPMPIMPGGLFLIDRHYFGELGFYDEGLKIWGAENIELSLKVWRCGGRVELVPCSRIGHVYKNAPHAFPKGESLKKNFKRVAELWLDDYKEFYYSTFPAASMLDAGNLTDAKTARDALQCESFDWFLENVYPEMFVPKGYSHQGMVSNAQDMGCLDVGRVAIASNPKQDPHVSPVTATYCSKWSDYNQWYFMPVSQRIIHIGIWIEECLGVKLDNGVEINSPTARKQKKLPVVVCQCAKYPGSGCTDEEIRWEYTSRGQLRHISTGRCLVATGDGTLSARKRCKSESKTGIWRFVDRWASSEGRPPALAIARGSDEL